MSFPLATSLTFSRIDRDHLQSSRSQPTIRYLPLFIVACMGFRDPESVIRNHVQFSKKGLQSPITLQSVLPREWHSPMESDWNSMQAHVKQGETTLVAQAVTPNILSYRLSWLELVHLSLGSELLIILFSFNYTHKRAAFSASHW